MLGTEDFGRKESSTSRFDIPRCVFFSIRDTRDQLRHLRDASSDLFNDRARPSAFRGGDLTWLG